MYEKKTCLLRFLVLFLGFSYVLSSSSAVPIITRKLKLNSVFPGRPTIVQGVAALKVEDLKMDEPFEVVEEKLLQGRMVLESNDYPGTGANNHHDPKAPGVP